MKTAFISQPVSTNVIESIDPMALVGWLVTRDWRLNMMSCMSCMDVSYSFMISPSGQESVAIPLNRSMDSYTSDVVESVGVICRVENVTVNVLLDSLNPNS